MPIITVLEMVHSLIPSTPPSLPNPLCVNESVKHTAQEEGIAALGMRTALLHHENTCLKPPNSTEGYTAR